MTHREARRGAALAGATLFAIPLVEVLYGLGTPGPVHFIVGSLGLALLGISGRWR